MAGWLNRRTARAYHRVICTTGWAAAEFERIGAANLARVPLGVDLATFTRRPGSRNIRARYISEGRMLLVPCGRLSAEKKPQRSLTTLATLRAQGLPVRLVVAGGGPLRTQLGRRAARAPAARHLHRLPGRARRPGRACWPAPTWPSRRAGGDVRAGRARGTGLRDPGGGERGVRAARGGGRRGRQRAGRGFRGRGARACWTRPEQSGRPAARARAERYDWDTAVRGFLAVHAAVVLETEAGADVELERRGRAGADVEAGRGAA